MSPSFATSFPEPSIARAFAFRENARDECCFRFDSRKNLQCRSVIFLERDESVDEWKGERIGKVATRFLRFVDFSEINLEKLIEKQR